MKKKLALVLMVLFIFTLFPIGAGATTEGANQTQTTQPTTEAATKAEDNFQEVIKSGNDPVWMIEKVDAPEKASTGSEIEITITARNMGTGAAVATEIQLRENDAPLESFEIIGGNGDVYTPQVGDAAPGETKIYKIKLKVKESARELEGGHKITATVRSHNAIYQEGTKRFSSSNVFYLDVRYALSEPTFVVEKVTFSPQITEGVTETTATFTIKNVSDAKANGVTVSLLGKENKDGEKNIKVQDLSSSKLVGDIGGEQRFTVDYQLKLNTARQDNEMVLTTNYIGATAPKEETLNLPLPLNESTNGKVPKVIINKYTVSPSKVYAGNQVTLTLYVENTNNRNVRNVQISLKVPENESSSNNATVSGGTVFSPINSSNTFYLDVIEGKSVVMKEINMFVDSNAAAKTYVVPVVIEYEDLDGNSHMVNDNVNIPVGQRSGFDIITQSVSSFAQVGMPLDYSVEFVNSGKVAMSNFKVFLECDTMNVSDQVYYIGTFDIGATDVFSGSIFPEVAGELNGNIVFTYDDNGEEVRTEYPFSVMVDEMQPMDDSMMPEMDPMMEEPPSLEDTIKKILIVAAIILVVGGGAIVGYRKHKKKKEEEALLND